MKNLKFSLIKKLTHIRILSFVLFILLLTGNSFSQPQPNFLKDLDVYIQKGMKDWECTGLAIAIVKNDSIIFSKGYGVRELGKNEPIDENTLFAIASNTKAFTATAIGMLVKEGKLKWDDPVIKYLPNLQLYDPYITRELTIRDLLCHRQGYSTWEADLIWYGSENSREEVLKQLRYVKPISSFRSQFGYSNMMFLAAGQIISSLSGMSWDDFIKERFFKPLEMTRSNTSTVDFKDTKNIATPHTKVEGRIVPIPYRNIDNVAPCGSINSSIHDIAQWIRVQLSKGEYKGKYVIDSNVIFETRNPFIFMRAGKSRLTHFSAYGLGWFLKDYNGRLVISHGGGMDGMLSQVGLIPEENLGLVILTNYDGQNFYVALFNYIIDAYLGVPLKDLSSIYLEQNKKYEQFTSVEKKKLEEPPFKDTKPTLSLKEYAGNYSNEILGGATITEKNDGLYLQFKKNKGLAGPIKHWYYDTFLCKWEDIFMEKSLVTFIIGVNGQVEEFRVKIREDFVDPLEYVFKKKVSK